MLCNMFLYVVQHVFRAANKCTIYIFPGTLHFLQLFSRSDYAIFADSCRTIHKKHRYEIENAPSPGRRKGGLAPLSCPCGNGAHGAPHPRDVFFTRLERRRRSAMGKRRMPEALSRPGHSATILSMKILFALFA